MSKKPVGLIIKSLIAEKNLSAEQMAKLTGKSRQQVYNDFNRVGMKDDEIEKYTNALQIEKQVVYDLLENKSVEGNESNYLQEHLTNLEEQFKRLLNQIDVKDRQIEGLQKTVDVLLGKSEPGTDEGKVMEMYKFRVA
ncbi:helix-turn-helix domain-containing protein [Dyadobacter diqingensis]|uniref:helix-turn-helix domain-containing protein n=1 Tax=Dyadobacter diqingensis TaxID=2938121 RepID=UPI0020C46F28|nr:helix-turn-helix transcriptional regulator [Dyadobacter diqingensis]